MLGFCGNFVVPQWMVSPGIQLVLGGLLFLNSRLVLAECPQFHVEPEKAAAVLAWLRNLPADHRHVRHELQAMQAQADRELALGIGWQ